MKIKTLLMLFLLLWGGCSAVRGGYEKMEVKMCATAGGFQICFIKNAGEKKWAVAGEIVAGTDYVAVVEYLKKNMPSQVAELLDEIQKKIK